MKKLVFVLIIGLFFVNNSYAQTTEKLTNSTIVKMVKANLSDDLIIDEINNSSVNFNVSADSVKFLSDENVSSRVIQAMKITNSLQTPSVPEDSMLQTSLVEPVILTLAVPEQPILIQAHDTLKQVNNEPLKISHSTDSLQKGSNKNILIENSTITINAISYVIPLEELITFFDNKYNSLSDVIKERDQRIRDSVDKGNQIKERMLQLEKEITDKKNADAKKYTDDIVMLKTDLTELRGDYKQFKNNMIIDGIKIAKECKEIGSAIDRSISDKFSEVSQIVKKTDPDPALGEVLKSLTLTQHKYNLNIVNYVAPLAEVLFFYRNEINSIQDLIVQWNAKAVAVIQKDAGLSKQLEPLKKELEDYKLNSKKNKKEIAALKKQCTKIEKERKQLANQMENDSKELSSYLKKICKDIQSSAEERFNDIFENINYSYQDNF